MELSHRFTVPTGIEEAWAHFNDIAALAECFPGAQVTSADEESFAGSVKVKLGPIALQYNGTGTFVEKDAAAKRFVVDAKGKDKRGNGTAGALVTVALTDAGGSTDVAVDTDLAITGKPAQFGRGVMQDVSDKLLGQFVACLEQRLAAAGAPAGDAAAAEPAASADPSQDGDSGPLGGGGTTHGVGHQAAPPPPRAAAEPQALNLGSAVLPVLVKSYGKYVLAALVGWAAVRRLLRKK